MWFIVHAKEFWTLANLRFFCSAAVPLEMVHVRQVYFAQLARKEVTDICRRFI